ncbi:hypothetical protein ACFVUN_32530 [Kitasatospora griseola]|uniref:hypothetical protein n=1 Tax=Kitasatospora griseola TaxID=2064 RepID=UPI0036DA7A28
MTMVIEPPLGQHREAVVSSVRLTTFSAIRAASLNSDGIVHYLIQANSRTPRGAEMLDAVMHEFDPENFRGISGECLAADSLAGNLTSHYAGIRDLLSPEVAAPNTFTGRMADRRGLSKVGSIKTVDTPKSHVKFSTPFATPEGRDGQFA